MNKLLLVITVLLTACHSGYNRYNVAISKYEQTQHLEANAAAAVEVLVTLGYEIDRVNRNVVETQWERYYQGRSTLYATEYQIRLVVDLKKSLIKGQCTERKIDRTGRKDSWFFKKCSNPILLRRINQTVDILQKRLPVLAALDHWDS